MAAAIKFLAMRLVPGATGRATQQSNTSAAFFAPSPAANRAAIRLSSPAHSSQRVLVCGTWGQGGITHRPAASKLRIFASVADPSREDEGTGERGFNDAMRVPSNMANIGTQLGGGGGTATLQRSSLDLSQSVQESKARTDDGQGGGNNGKNINNGGGGDGGDNGDDDDYFDDEDGDEGDDGVFTKRSAIPELFDRATIECVLQEWYKTIHSLPNGIRMAVEMGLVSSAQLVRFLGVDARPSLVRTVARKTPAVFSRGFVGRMMGDPSILLKLAFEQAMAAGITICYEAQQRGDKFKSELDLVAVNVVSVLVTNAAMVWLLCPNRSFGAPIKYPWQRTLGNLPSNCFDKSGPLREYTNVSRGMGFLYKAAQLSAIGTAVGAVSGGVSNLLVGMRQKKEPEFQPALATPSTAHSASGYGAYCGLTGNVRYQLLNGLDRYMLNTFSSLPLTLGVSALARFGGQELGEQTRLHWLGLPKQSPKKQRVRNVVVKKTVKRVRKVKKTRTAATAAEATTAETTTAAPAKEFSVSASVGKRTHH
uniref:Uncharacterized protein n=1 Tax=Pyramimonas obovata TaxID=1411642 RepID=A0A7S0N4C8_9CHLO|mmetsp:Transcript_19995/g.43752  ORF Transcript_19995/g.43752 Transcript_19995/m.43752 type:complete len:537 (+) Transcript_19995:123-1733(+)